MDVGVVLLPRFRSGILVGTELGTGRGLRSDPGKGWRRRKGQIPSIGTWGGEGGGEGACCREPVQVDIWVRINCGGAAGGRLSSCVRGRRTSS